MTYAHTDIKRAVIDVTGLAGNDIVAAVAGKALLVMEFFVTVALLTDLTWRSDTDALTGAMRRGIDGQIKAEWLDEGHFQTAPGEALNLLSSVDTQQSGWVSYVEL